MEAILQFADAATLVTCLALLIICLIMLIVCIWKIGVPLTKTHSKTQAHLRDHLDRQLTILDKISQAMYELTKAQSVTNDRIESLTQPLRACWDRQQNGGQA